MKKCFLFLILFTFSVQASNQEFNVNNLTVEQKQTMLSRFNNGLEYFSDNLDNMLTRKGLFKTFIVAIPFISLYVYLFPPEPAAELLGRMLNYGIDSTTDFGSKVVSRMLDKTDNLETLVTALGEFEGRYGLAKEIGQKEAFWDMLYEKPLSSLTLLVSSTADKIWNSGLPFISVILANKYFNVQH